MSDWQYNTPYNIGQPGSTNLVGYRDILDAKRTNSQARIPSAEYPDGYLGTIINRREDRLLKAVQGRMTDRNYQRGVHKGEKLDPRDYYWPEEFQPDTGIRYEARGLQWTARGSVTERLAHGGMETASPQEMAAAQAQYGVDAESPKQIDPLRQQRLARLLPQWR